MLNISSKESIKELIGLRVKCWRKKNGVTQEVLAAKLNCSTSRLSKIETGKQLISTDQLIIGLGLGWDINEILRVEISDADTEEKTNKELQFYLGQLDYNQKMALLRAIKILNSING